MINPKLYLIDLFHTIEEVIPPSSGHHHCISTEKYGNDTDGYTDELVLHIDNKGNDIKIFLYDKDLLVNPRQLALSILRNIKAIVNNDYQVILTGEKFSNVKTL
jgi:hypothetical protein